MSGNGSSDFKFESGQSLSTPMPSSTNSGMSLFNMQSRSVGGLGKGRRRKNSRRKSRKTHMRKSRRSKK
jgi:hypothetical protein